MNTHLLWLKRAVHLAYPQILWETTVCLSGVQRQRIPLLLWGISFCVSVSCFSFHGPPLGSRNPLSFHLSILKSQMSTFQSDLEGLFQVLCPSQKASFLVYSNPLISLVSELAYSFFKTQYFTKNSYIQLQLPYNCFMYGSLISPT